jgi:hypothetical protein
MAGNRSEEQLFDIGNVIHKYSNKIAQKKMNIVNGEIRFKEVVSETKKHSYRKSKETH